MTSMVIVGNSAFKTRGTDERLQTRLFVETGGCQRRLRDSGARFLQLPLKLQPVTEIQCTLSRQKFLKPGRSRAWKWKDFISARALAFLWCSTQTR